MKKEEKGWKRKKEEEKADECINEYVKRRSEKVEEKIK